MASQSINTADWTEATTETLYLEKYVIVLRRSSIAGDWHTLAWVYMSVGIAVYYAFSSLLTRDRLFFSGGRKWGVSESLDDFTKKKKKKITWVMSLSVLDMNKYSWGRGIKRPEWCLMEYPHPTGSHAIRQWHSNGPSVSTIVPLTVIRS